MLLLNSSTKAAVNKEEDNLFLMIDEDMQHLYELTTKMKKNENDIGAIISILQEKVPLLLDGLPIFSQHKIAQYCNLKIYYKDEVVFHQGGSLIHIILLYMVLSLFMLRSHVKKQQYIITTMTRLLVVLMKGCKSLS